MEAGDSEGIQRLVEYFLRCPFSQARMIEVTAEGQVLDKTEHTVMTAAQEIAALVPASAIVARERMRAAAGQTPVLRVSFIKLLELLRPRKPGD